MQDGCTLSAKAFQKFSKILAKTMWASRSLPQSINFVPFTMPDPSIQFHCKNIYNRENILT